MKIAGGAAGELTPNVLLGGKADMAVALRSIRSLAIWLFDDGGDSIAVQVLPPGSQRSPNVKVFLEFLAAKVTSMSASAKSSPYTPRPYAPQGRGPQPIYSWRQSFSGPEAESDGTMTARTSLLARMPHPMSAFGGKADMA